MIPKPVVGCGCGCLLTAAMIVLMTAAALTALL